MIGINCSDSTSGWSRSASTNTNRTSSPASIPISRSRTLAFFPMNALFIVPCWPAGGVSEKIDFISRSSCQELIS